MVLNKRTPPLINFWKFSPTPGPYLDPCFLIFANFNFSTCKIFKYILSIKGTLNTSFVREVYFKINEISMSVGINIAKLYLIFRYGFRYGFSNLTPLPALIWTPRLLAFQDFPTPPTICTPTFIRHCRVHFVELSL